MSQASERVPTIQTPRLVLRPPRLDDAADMFAYAQDPEVARHTTWEPHQSIADSRAFLEQVIASNAEGRNLTWAIALPDSDRMIGTIGLLLHSARDRRAELGYAIGRDYWNRGLMTEAAAAVIRYAFEGLGLNRVEALCELVNTASARVMEKLGMRQDGVLRQYFFVKGSYRDLKLYSVLRDDWASRGSSLP